MGKIVGIDLGTTKSVIALYEGDKPVIYPNLKGDRTTPSYVALKKNKDKKTKEVTTEWVVGKSAKNQVVTNPVDTIYGVKRLIGRRFDEPEVQKMKELASYKIVKGPNGDAWVEVGGKAMSPVEISAKVLRELKESIEKQLGEEVTEAVVTVPAYFNDAQREATKTAGKLAGLDVKRIINEPTAAALAYGMDKKKDGKIAVFDLGGGTFDLSILDITVDEESGGSMISVISTCGDTFLGGENFDERIVEHLVAKLNAQNAEDGIDVEIDLSDKESREKYAAQLQRLRSEAEKAKIELSSQDNVEINLPFLMQDDDGETVNFSYDMSRRELEDLLRDLVEKTLPPFKQALKDAGLEKSDLEDVILVGAQTRMPLVIDTVKEFFGREPRRDVIPDEIVAMGASVQGAILQGNAGDVLLVDVTPLSIGIKTANDGIAVMIPRNTTIPAEFKDTFSTAADNQPDVCIQIAQGERPQFSSNQELGSFTLDGLPPAKANTLKIEVSVKIDENGVLDVKAKDLKTGREQKVTIEKNGGLTEEQIEEMLKNAEAHAEEDRLFQEARSAEVDAKYMLDLVKNDEDQEWFKSGPEDLVSQFRETVTELTEALGKKDVAAMKENAQKLNDTRIALGDAFSNASANDNDGQKDDVATKAAADPETPAAANADDTDTAPAAKKPAPPAPPAA